MISLRGPSSTATLCLSETNLIALMGTAVALTAAATFWCTRRFRRCSTGSVVNLVVDSRVPVVSAGSPVSDDFSYVCTSCGTEKYSSDAPSVLASSKSPYKMVILVRTDLNMVIYIIIHLLYIDVSYIMYRTLYLVYSLGKG